MTAPTDTLERQLLADLEGLGERLDDERLTRDLYAVLAGFTLSRSEGRIALSWKRAEEVINAARERHGLEPVTLAQTGVEGAPADDRAGELLESLGWQLEPRPTDRNDPAHVWSDEDPPPADREPPEWEREAHAEADAERHRRRTGETRQELHERHRRQGA
jgi:hypothetical protein